MDADLQRRVDDLFDRALDLPPEQRARFVVREAAGDESLRAEVEALLAEVADDEARGTSVQLDDGSLGGLLDGGALRGPLFDGFAERFDASPTADLPTGSRVGSFRIVREIGRGGMAVVYEAERVMGGFEQRAAIKVIQAGVATDDVLRRFEQERQILATLEHGAIARVYEGGATADGRPYLAMELVDGRPIDRYCDEERLPIEERLRLVSAVARAVGHAHRRLVVHRDLKPANILVTKRGEIKLLDFGIAKLLDPATSDQPVTRTSVRPMTPEYASPEQVLGQPVSTASDVYQLGLLLYRLLTGRPPYGSEAPTRAELERAIVEEPPSRPSAVVTRAGSSVSMSRSGSGSGSRDTLSAEAARQTSPRRLRQHLRGDLDNVALMALRKEPERRYGSVDQLAEDLERFLAGRPVRARADTWRYRATKFVGRHRVAVAAAAAIVLLLVGYAATVTVQRQEIARERDAARAEAVKAREVTRLLLDLFELADPDRARGRQLLAREILDRGVAQIEGRLSDQPDSRAQIVAVLGEIYRKLGHFDEAEPLLDEALALQRELDTQREIEGDTPSLDFAQVLLWTARCRADRSRFDEATALAEEAYSEALVAAGPDAPLTVEAMAYTASLATLRGDNDLAEQRLVEALDRQRAVEPLSERAGEILALLGEVYLQKREVGRGRDLLREALLLDRQVLGRDHPQTLSVQNELATLLTYYDEFEEAERLLRDVEDRTRRIFGPRHPRTASALQSLGSMALEKGDRPAAVAALREARSIFEESVGRDSLEWLIATNSLAASLFDDPTFEEAAVYYREALDGFRRVLGEQHERVAQTQSSLADLYDSMGRFDEAEALYRQALEVSIAVYGEDHPTVARRRAAIAFQQLAHGELTDAAAQAQRSLEIYNAAPSLHGHDVAKPRLVLAWLAYGDGRVDEAVALAREAHELRTNLYGSDRVLTTFTGAALGAFLAVAGERDEALEHALPALEHLRAVEGEGYWYVRRIDDVLRRAGLVDGSGGAVSVETRAVEDGP